MVEVFGVESSVRSAERGNTGSSKIARLDDNQTRG